MCKWLNQFPVAVPPFIKFSWYRLLIMELVDRSGYSGDEENGFQLKRVADAVRAVGD